MLSIFSPLNPDDPPAGGATGFRGRNVVTGPFAPDMDDALWKTLLTWLWMPALAVFLTLELWIGIPPVLGWVLVIAFIAGYAVLGWMAYRRRRG